MQKFSYHSPAAGTQSCQNTLHVRQLMTFVRRSTRDTTSESLPRTVKLVELNRLPNLIQKFDPEVRAFVDEVRHGRNTTTELGLT